jgi:hypothetical protein
MDEPSIRPCRSRASLYRCGLAQRGCSKGDDCGPYTKLPFGQWLTKEKNTVREFGNHRRDIVPARSYDALFYIDTTTPAIKE